MNFYGREKEKKSLERFYSRTSQMAALIYGRRRVGKSELIKQSLRETDISSVYYECRQTTEMNNVESLSLLISEKYGYPRLAFSKMEEVLDFLFRQAEKERLILVLDEYSYIRDVVKGMDSILQVLIDQYKETSQLKLIVCGSFVDTMKSLLLVQSPLYGRIDLTMELKPMDYYESALFYRTFSDEDKVKLYSVFGGIPYYNRLIDPALTVKENVIDLIASPGARLEMEISMYLRSEVSKMVNANEVFDALARGYSRYSDILSQSHVSSSPTLADTLEKLIRMELVRKEAPINDENNRRKSGYYIADSLSLFYYRYIFRYSSQMNVMEPELFFDRYIKQDFEEKHVPRMFEEVCRQYLIRQNRLGRLEEPFEKIGTYYYDDPKKKMNGEFDIVTLDSRGYIFYEAKFRKAPLTRKLMEQEIAQVENSPLSCYKYGFFSRAGFEANMEHVMMFTLEDLFS